MHDYYGNAFRAILGENKLEKFSSQKKIIQENQKTSANKVPSEIFAEKKTYVKKTLEGIWLVLGESIFVITSIPAPYTNFISDI